MIHFDCPIILKSKTLGLKISHTKINVSIFFKKNLYFAHLFTWERGELWAKHMGYKMWCYWEHIEEYIEKLGELQPIKKLINDAKSFSKSHWNEWIYVCDNKLLKPCDN